jgi:hypothetical protein
MRVLEVTTSGVKYPVKFGFNAYADLCDLTGMTINDLQKFGDKISPGVARDLVWCGLKHGARVKGEKFILTREDVGDMMDDDAEFAGKVFEAFAQSQPVAEKGKVLPASDGKKKNP